MGKHGSTKGRIIKLISQGNNNLSKISKTLDLAPSTVSKHLHDLENEGLIRREENHHVKKWKYYRLNSNAPLSIAKLGETLKAKSRIIATAMVILLLVSAALTYIYVVNASYKTIYIPIRITDPPQVPYGTQTLYINYSSLTTNISYQGISKTIEVNSSGRLNLISLVNYTQIIGGVNIKPNSTIDSIRFNITSASIIIDNVTYNVSLIDKQVTARVENNVVLNSSSAILLDFSSIVTSAYTDNSLLFVLLPSLRAIAVPNPAIVTRGLFGIRTPQPPTAPLPQRYKEIFSITNTNLKITNVTLSSNENLTLFNVTLDNFGANDIRILNVILYGNDIEHGLFNSTIMNNTPETNPLIVNSSNLPGYNQDRIQINCSMRVVGSNEQRIFRLCQQSDTGIEINASMINNLWPYFGANSIEIRLHKPIINISISNPSSPMSNAFNQEFIFMRPQAIDFLVNENGTLSLQWPRMMFEMPPRARGYLLQPNSKVTVSYKGDLEPLYGGLPILINKHGAYKVLVITDHGIVQTNFTSS